MRKLAKYVLVGGSTALLELGIFSMLSPLFGIPVAFSNVVAVLIATICNYCLNQSFTFKSSGNPLRGLILYYGLFAVNLCFSTWAIIQLSTIGAPLSAAKALTQICISCWNFVLYKTVIFPNHESHDDSAGVIRKD